ncbi:MAG TPA: phosphatidate cytidylyltransferase [Sedimentisphaerales bacterium]|nr:phosphatidate cytidylyltransferase [Sedimentisphaerales bacterium]
MIKHRLLFGALMIAAFGSVVILDGLLDGSLTASAPDKPVQGTVLCILIAALALPAQLELAKLAAARNVRIFAPFGAVASILLATTWYWPQLTDISQSLYLAVVLALVLAGLLLHQQICCGTTGVIVNCGASLFGICYLGLLSGFVLAIRIDFGLWPLLMFVGVIKCADIGAWSVGKMFGRHKFSPRISPGKTWEGMGGAVVAGTLAAVLFATFCDIMVWPAALIFGVCFAFIGQLGDLAESMIKRDAQQKDSANKVPGFGGILDIIDSPLLAAPLAYLFFAFCAE